MRVLPLFLTSFLISACSNISNTEFEKMKTVPFVDINKFMGDWYVIANIPTFIDKGATNAIESYRLNKKGEVETTFTFNQDSPNGIKKVYTPKGFIYDKQTNAEWRMQFIWPIKMPFLIIDLADDYSHTVIGYPNRNYVWIMAREPQLSDETYSTIIDRLKDIGYDISKIHKVQQRW